MTFRKIVSLSVGLSFVVLLITGILSYFNAYSRTTATLHTVFGILFSLGVLFHLKNNFLSIKRYTKGSTFLFVLLALVFFVSAGYFQITPLNSIMDFGARSKAKSIKELNFSEYEVIQMNTEKDVELTLNLLRSEHYWHPQMAIWLEDENGNYLETLFVSKATAKGLFFGGRTKDNYKNFDESSDAPDSYRRVNALPVWSHKRGVQYADGLYVPTHQDEFPDAITGETIIGNFNLSTSTHYGSNFNIRVELNVAFDDNEYYSEYDFPDDEVFHAGTGQLGQPSIIFESLVDLTDGQEYYLMELVGHGHRSGQTGELYHDLSTLTTAKQIVERIVVSAKKKE